MGFRLPLSGRGELRLGAAMSSVAALLVLSATSAQADCLPDPATSGQTVTCSSDANGFDAGGVNNLTVNVLAGATVNDNGVAAISLSDTNVVTNNGTVAAGSGLTGIGAGNFNTVTNNAIITAADNGLGISLLNNNTVANKGTITTGDGGVAISVQDDNVVGNSAALSVGASATGIFAGFNNTITNSAAGTITGLDNTIGIYAFSNTTIINAGAITVGASGGFPSGGGIFAIGGGNTVTNTATGRITVGDGATGIFMQGNFQTANNAGSITTGQFGTGVTVAGDDAKVTNTETGTITVAGTGAGMQVQGDRAVIVQAGTINVGAGGLGAGIVGLSGTLTNTGKIIGADGSTGLALLGDDNILTNRGTITVGDGGTGIFANTISTTNQIINTNTITVGVNGVGISASGGLSVFNSGTINAATGFAAIDLCGCGNNTLTLGPGSIINGQVFASGTDTFQLGGTGKDTFNLSLLGVGLQYDGFSTFNKIGSSTWTVTGTGNQDWNVLGGTLSLAGTINGNVTIASGGTFGGVGATNNVVVNNGGTFAPGSPTGTLNVNGDLAFTAASTYMVQVSGASNGIAVVTGTSALNGATVTVVPVGSIANHYKILTAGTLPDTFNPVVTGLSPNLKATLSYDPNNAYLDLVLGYGGGLNINQQNVANVLTRIFNAGGSLPVALANLSPQGLSQASGEPATGTQQTTFNAMNLFLSLLTDPFSSGRGISPTGATPFAAETGARSKAARDAFASIYNKAPSLDFEQRWNVWAAGYGGSQTTDGNTALGSNNTTSNIYGTAVGVDYRVSPSTLAGFALAGGGTSFNVNGLGWGRSDLFQAGAFVRHVAGQAYVTAALAYGWQDVTTNRTVTVAGFDQLRAQFNASAISGRIEGGHRTVTPWMGLTPYAAVQATAFILPGYGETLVAGTNNAFALTYAGKTVTDTRTELGLRTDKSFGTVGGIVTLRGRIAWAHDFNPDRTVGAVFQALPGSAFVVNGAAQSRDSALTTASAEMRWMNGWSAAGTFAGEFSNVTRSYAGKGVVRYAW